MSNNFLVKLAPYLAGIGYPLINADDNETGADDLVGQLLVYASQVIAGVSNGEADLPPLPPTLEGAVVGRLSGAAKTAVLMASGAIGIAELQLAGSKPRAAKALRYVNQVLAALAAGRPAPTAPTF